MSFSITIHLLLIGFILGVTTVHSIMEQPGGIPNFGPHIENNVIWNPDFQPDPPETDPVAIAKQYIEKSSRQYPVTSRVSSSYRSEGLGVTHTCFQQLVNGIEVQNGVANVNIDRNGKIMSSGNSFFRNQPPPPPTTPTEQVPLTAKEAVIEFAKFIKADVDSGSLQQTESEGEVLPVTVTGAAFASRPIIAKQNYMIVDGGSRLVLVWSLNVHIGINHYNVYVDTRTGDIIALHNSVSS